MLDTILKHGFSPSVIEPPAATRWPTPCDLNWMSKALTPDPFFVDYFALILSYEPGFAGVTQLQEHILTGKTLGSEFVNQKELLSAVNFLGQSPLHLAVGKMDTVVKLVELGHDLNALDIWGITPLMYAAATGFEDVTVHLLLVGANPGLQETRFNRTFLEYAIIGGQWNLIHRALSTIHDLYPKGTHQVLVQLVVLRAMSLNILGFTEDLRRQHLPILIQHCDNVNFSIKDSESSVTDNNLMHYAKTLEEARALVCRSFNLFNKPNSVGKLAINSHIYETELFSFCIEHRTGIDHVNANGRTLLLTLLSLLGGFNARNRTILKQIRRCLDLGADARHSDDCNCPCSPGGCSSSAFFVNGFQESWLPSQRPEMDIMWVFEWQSILQDFYGDEAVREFMLSFIRRIEFDELGMTHVCCHSGLGMTSECDPRLCRMLSEIRDNENTCEILEEEGEFIDILEQTMHELSLKAASDLQT